MADLNGVELARPGQWELASGPMSISAEMLHDAARYAQRKGARPSPVKLGHTDPRFTGDGEPALGWLANLRVEDHEGPVLMGDISGMPDWLAAAAPAAWPDRSVEGWTDYEADDGVTYAFVVDGLALLGVTPPGMSSIRSLRDLPQALGVAASARIVARAPEPPAPQSPTKEGAGLMDPAKIREALGLAADASDDEVRAAFAAASLTPKPPTEPVPTPDPTPEPRPEPTAVKPELVNASAGTRVVAESVWEQTQTTIKTLTDFVAKTKRDERDAVIAKAVTAGKFTPAQKPHFSKLWDADPDGTRVLIDSLTPNSALAVMASGYAGEADEVDNEYAGLYRAMGKVG